MVAGFDWWLLILGVLVGGGIAWLLVADFRRADDDVATDELAREAERIAGELTGPASGLSPAGVAEVLARHRAYLADRTSEVD